MGMESSVSVGYQCKDGDFLVGNFVETHDGKKYRIMRVDSDGMMTLDYSGISEAAEHILRKLYGHNV